MTDTQRTELRRAFEAFAQSPFPSAESDDDEIAELRAELAEYDGYIAGIVGTLVGHGNPEHPLTRNDAVYRRLRRLMREGAPATARDARRLLDYLEALYRLIDLAKGLDVPAATAELNEWTRWWRRRGEAGLRALLMALWDPIGVAGIPEARDEYDNYLLQVVKRLRAGASDEELAGYLGDVRVGAMGLFPNRPADLDVAQRIRAWYVSESGQYEDESPDRSD